MGMLIMMRKGNYTNSDAVEKVIRYISRTRVDEKRADELVAWGGAGIGYYGTPEWVIEQFRLIQNIYNIEERKGRRIFHETFRIREEEFAKLGGDFEALYQMALQCSQYYYMKGHQVVFAIHSLKMPV